MTSVPLRILIVEDSAEDAAATLLELSRGGHAPDWRRVETAEELRAALAEGHWDVVLSDYMLPGFGAAAALALCREADPILPFVVVSGAVGEQKAVEMMRAGAGDYLLKGNLARLAPAVEREMREAENRRARRRAEQGALLLAAVVESSDDAIVSQRSDGCITSWNPAAERLFGWTAEEAVGRDLSFIVPPDRANQAARISERLRRGEHVEPFETTRVSKGGDRVRVSITSSSLRDRDDQVIGLTTIARDVTAKKAAEEATARNAMLLASVQDSVIVTDLDGVVTYWNEGAARLFGWTAQEMLLRPLVERLPAAARPASASNIQAMAAGIPRSGESHDFRKDGSRVWIDARAAFIHDHDGETVGFIEVSHDITAQKEAQAALQASEERYRTLVAANTSIVWNTPASGEFETEQSAWTAFTGQTFRELEGWGWLNAVHIDDRPETARVWAAAVADQRVYRVEHRLRRWDGAYRRMAVRAVPLLDAAGAIREWVGVHTDVDEQRQAAIERDDLLARLNVQVERLPLAYLLSGPDFRYTRWNPAAERIFGWSEAEVLGKHPFEVVVPPQSEAPVAAIFERLKAGDMQAHGVFENTTRDGRTITCQWYNTPLMDQDGRFAGLLSLAQDVTEQRILEDQFRQAQKMDAVGQLAGGVAHDFNNMLCIINGYSELLLDGLPPDHPNFDPLNQIRVAGERSVSLTRQLLAFSRKEVVAPRILNLNVVVADTEKMLRRLIGEDVPLTTSLAGELGSVLADEGQIQQVLMNLALNARDAMPQGGRLTIKTRNVELEPENGTVRAGGPLGRYVLLTVSDTGAGMTGEVKGHLFEPFFTTKGQGKGTGLGLAVVHGVVKQAGGRIEVRSEPGAGASFEIYLPRVDQPPRKGRPLSATKIPPRGDETILMVEDDDGVRLLTRHMLKELGYAVLEASGGADAIRIAVSHDAPIHLLITDVIMPGLSGRQVAEQLAILHPNARLLFVSGYNDDAVVRHGILQDTVHFLPKPFSLIALACKIREVLSSPATGPSQQVAEGLLAKPAESLAAPGEAPMTYPSRP